jgi:DNA polymerase I-like protein with 3'-5' exonuclease and polymerase domains
VARIIFTDTSVPEDIPTQMERDWVYNGLDCCVTAECLEAQLPQFDPVTQATYDLERSLQGPVLEMNLRGVLIDQDLKATVIDELYEKLEFLERNLDRIVLDGVGMRGFNWKSAPDRQALFYDHLGLPTIKRMGRPTVDRAAREKMMVYTVARPILAHMNALADIYEKIKKLKSEVDPDNRMRTTYNIAGTNTGRKSSSQSIYGTGGNLQNVEEALRSLFIADPGMKWCKVDAKQIQSRIVGAIQWKLFKNGTYLDACEGADLHTHVAKLVWPGLPWTGNPKADKRICDNRETPFYRHFTHRDLCKKLGHGTNFKGAPPTLSQQTGVPLELVVAFQPKYMNAFPGHDEWHQWVAHQLTRHGYITGITGRKRWFFDRRTDEDTIRAAVAYDPQNSEAYIVDSAMLKIWRNQTATIMMHEHDGLVYQYPAHLEDEIIPQLLTQLEVPVDIGHGRTLIVPYEAKVGFNRGEYNERTNPNGLRDYTPGDQGRRREAKAGLLDRPIRRAHG